jgi:heme iron utilization protein
VEGPILRLMNTAQTATLRHLLNEQPIASLGTLRDGDPWVSMVPFSLLHDPLRFVIRVSGLAAHTGNMLDAPRVSLMVMASETRDVSPQALARITIQGVAEQKTSAAPGFASARDAYLARFPDTSETLDLHDFSFFIVLPTSIRFIGGFAQAFTLTPEQLADAMRA